MNLSGRRAVASSLMLLAGLAALSDISVAGTLCGTVRDALTAAPVQNAGAFLYTAAGAYTGLHAATDADGVFCIADVAPGTYTLQIRVDDYTAAVIRNIEVADEVTMMGGTICGTVRDKITAAPVQNAGAFLFTQSGDYTGLYAATGADGVFCIREVAAGTYTLQIRVDDYVAAVIHDVEVKGDVIGIRIETPPPNLPLLPPWPNPARGPVHLAYGFGDASDLDLLITDVQGGIVRAFQGTSALAGERTLDWNLRDRTGARVAPGIYFIRLTDGKRAVTRRVTVIP